MTRKYLDPHAIHKGLTQVTELDLATHFNIHSLDSCDCHKICKLQLAPLGDKVQPCLINRSVVLSSKLTIADDKRDT